MRHEVRIPVPVEPQELDGLDADLFDYAKLSDYLGFAVGAARRHKLRFAAVFAACVGLSGVLVAVLPKTYSSEIKIQAQRNQVISTLAGLNRAQDFDTPTRGAADLVLREDNLVSLVHKTDLIHTWGKNRAPLPLLKDKLMRALGRVSTDEQMEAMLVGTLEKKVFVTPGEDSVTIEVEWGDPQTAYRLVVAAHENFLEARQFREVSAISEAIGLLESRTTEERAKVSAAADRLLQLRNVAKAKAVAKDAERARPRPVVRPPVDLEVQRLRASLQASQRAIQELEETRRRRIAELETKLVEFKQVYSEFHPAVVDLQENIRQSQRAEPPQLEAMRQEYRRLEDEYQRRGGSALDSASALPPEAVRFTQTLNDEIESSEIEQAKGELRYALGKYATLLERIDAAKLDRETQRAAFRYRYGVLRPASMPLSPTKPKIPLVLASAAVAGLLLGLFTAILTDLRSKVIYERWQIERQLELPVLAEVRDQ